MQNTEIIISNVLGTGTAFAVLAEDMTQNVFVPSRLTQETPVRPGDRVAAMLVPNQVKPDKTPWVAIQINDVHEKPQSSLADKIRWELANGPATTIELAGILKVNSSDIQHALEAMKLPRTDLWALEMVDLMPEAEQ